MQRSRRNYIRDEDEDKTEAGSDEESDGDRDTNFQLYHMVWFYSVII